MANSVGGRMCNSAGNGMGGSIANSMGGSIANSAGGGLGSRAGGGMASRSANGVAASVAVPRAAGSAAKRAEPFTVMAKPVGSRCNMECSYCYYLDRPRAPGLARMPDAVLGEYVRQYIEASLGPAIQFTWHGGEPTLAGLDFYRRAVELQRRHLPAGWECWNNLQTNGLLLDDEWCAFLARERFDVGLSVDGAQRAHDECRRDRGGGATYAAVAEAARRLQAHGIQPDLLCAVTPSVAAAPLEAYRALRGLGTGWLQFIPIVRRAGVGSGREAAPGSVGSEEYGRFLGAVFDEWIMNDVGRLGVQLFAEAALVWSGAAGAASLCWMAPECGQALVVEQDGGVYSCDHFVDAAHRLGSIAAGAPPSLGEIAASPAQRRFGEAKRAGLPQRCLGCAWLGVCNGGCPKDRFAAGEGGEQGLNYLCGGLSLFFSHAERPLKRLIELRKGGALPEAAMAALREEARASERARWAGVGRNDPCPCGSGRKAKSCCWHKRPASMA
jgi:uncharacterized protein